jgi:hypothetical protein
MEQHIRIVGVLYIIFGILGLIAAVLVLYVGWFAGYRDIAIAAGTSTAILSLPNLIAGIGLKNRPQWARILTIILSVLNLFQFPFGTALGVYALWALLNEQSKSYFV